MRFDIASPFDGEPREAGERLRDLRRARGLTIHELASKAGVSVGTVSQLERGKSNPAIKTLQRIRAALDSEPANASSGTFDEAIFVQHLASRPRTVLGESRLVEELLSSRADRSLRFSIVTLPPGSVSGDVLVTPGYKGGLVLAGRLELTVGRRTVNLIEGDSFQFRCHVHHRMENRSDDDVKLIWIIGISDYHL